jgi:hypothetical protein
VHWQCRICEKEVIAGIKICINCQYKLEKQNKLREEMAKGIIKEKYKDYAFWKKWVKRKMI